MNEKLAKEILRKLENASDLELLNMLDDLRKDSSPGILAHLLSRWKKSDNKEVTEKLFAYFADLKDADALETVMQAMRSEDNLEKRNSLISVLWLSSLDASEHLEELVEMAIDGDLMSVVEISTVIENLDAEFNEEEIMECIYRIDEELIESDDEDKVSMLDNLKELVNKLKVS